LDPYVCVDVKEYTTKIASEEYVRGNASYPISISLDMDSQRAVDGGVSYCKKSWCNSYNGTAFGVRHLLRVEVLRPWYTFNCYHYQFLSLQRMVRDPIPESSTAPSEVAIAGLQGRGKCVFRFSSLNLDVSRTADPSSYGRGGASTGGAIKCTLRLSALEDYVLSAKVMLIRSEVVGETVAHTNVEFEHTVFGVDDEAEAANSTARDLEVAPKSVAKSWGYWERLDMDDSNPRPTDPVRIGSVISFEIPLDGYTNIPRGLDPENIAGFQIHGKKSSHEHKLQLALWNDISIHPSFNYAPFVAPPGTELPSEREKENDEEENGNHESDDSAKKEDEKLIMYPVQPEEAVSLRYYVRVVIVENGGRKLWNTQEIRFYDSGRATIPPYVTECNNCITNSSASQLQNLDRV